MALMAVMTPPRATPEPGAPFPRDAIDPELIRLARTRPQIGVITAAGVVAVCAYLVASLWPDRRFAGEPEAPRRVALEDIAAGRVAVDSFVAVEATPLYGQAVRVATSDADMGRRVAPARGAEDRVWLVLGGHPEPTPASPGPAPVVVGRVRQLADLRFGPVVSAHLAAHPRPVFATAAAVRAGLAAGAVTTVSGALVRPADSDPVAFTTAAPRGARVIAALVGARRASEGDPGHGPLHSPAAWIAELGRHGVTATEAPAESADPMLGQARLDVALAPDEVERRLAAARLLATRVEPLLRHHRTTWGALRAAPPAELAGAPPGAPAAQIDLVGIYAERRVDPAALAVISGERPGDYWYVTPAMLALGGIGLLFAWALARGLRELLPTRRSAPAPESSTGDAR